MSVKVRAASLLAAAAIMGAALPAAAETIGDGFTVPTSLQVTGVPATISYGSVAPGSTSGVQTVDASVTTNGAWRFDLSAGGFDGPGGATLGKGAREVILSTGSGSGVTLDEPADWRSFDSGTLEDGAPEATGGAGSDLLVRLELRVTVPGTATAGAYSGAITYQFSGS